MNVAGAKKYRKKPVVIEAMQFVAPNSAVMVAAWVGKDAKVSVDGGRVTLLIHTLEGDLTVSPLDYVIRGVDGEHYPCKPEIFEKTYERAD